MPIFATQIFFTLQKKPSTSSAPDQSGLKDDKGK